MYFLEETPVPQGVPGGTGREPERESGEGASAGGRPAGWARGQGTPVTALLVSEDTHHLCPALIVPFACVDFWL